MLQHTGLILLIKQFLFRIGHKQKACLTLRKYLVKQRKTMSPCCSRITEKQHPSDPLSLVAPSSEIRRFCSHRSCHTGYERSRSSSLSLSNSTCSSECFCWRLSLASFCRLHVSAIVGSALCSTKLRHHRNQSCLHASSTTLTVAGCVLVPRREEFKGEDVK
jgi:hypothetical protein